MSHWRRDWQMHGGDSDVPEEERRVETRVTTRAISRLSLLTQAARQRRAKAAAEISSWLDELIGTVERGVRQGESLWGGLLQQVARVEAASARVRARRRRREEQQAQQRSAAMQGDEPLHHDAWVVERILHVREMGGGGVKVLVRWAGGHDDSWRAYSQLNGAMQRAVQRWQTSVGGRPPGRRGGECLQQRNYGKHTSAIF